MDDRRTSSRSGSSPAGPACPPRRSGSTPTPAWCYLDRPLPGRPPRLRHRGTRPAGAGQDPARAGTGLPGIRRVLERHDCLGAGRAVYAAALDTQIRPQGCAARSRGRAAGGDHEGAGHDGQAGQACRPRSGSGCWTSSGTPPSAAWTSTSSSRRACGPPAPICSTTRPRSRSRPGSSWPSWSATLATGPRADERGPTPPPAPPGRRWAPWAWPSGEAMAAVVERLVALAAGIDPASAEARLIADEIAACIAADPAQAADPAFRHDGRPVGGRHRRPGGALLQLVGTLNGWGEMPSTNSRTSGRSPRCGRRRTRKRHNDGFCRASPGEPAPFRAHGIEA